MRWRKKGLICSWESLDLSWYRSFTLMPKPFRLDKRTIRILITFGDEQNIGRIARLDVAADNPGQILEVGAEPVLDIGPDGAFDDHGVVTASTIESADWFRLYYSGYHLESERPYSILGGVAFSLDRGLSAVRGQSEPILPKNKHEPSNRAALVVHLENGRYKMWYLGDVGEGWVSNAEGKRLPCYRTKYLESADGLVWPPNPGTPSLSFQNADEHGLALHCLWRENGLYKIIYSIRTLSKGYRLGYGESADGKVFTRKDAEIGIDVSKRGWDSEMICFGHRFVCDDKIYLFYCGNGYGRSGFGYAELENG